MHATKSQKYMLERFLLEKKSMVLLDAKHQDNEHLPIPNKIVIPFLHSLRDQGMLIIQGNWRRLYCLLTEKGHNTLKLKVGLPSEESERELQEIKN